MKKVELVFPRSLSDSLIKILSEQNIPGYTILEVHSNYGAGHGNSLDVRFSSSQYNLYLFSVCEDAIARDLIAAVSESIKEVGGLILSSDVQAH